MAAEIWLAAVRAGSSITVTDYGGTDFEITVDYGDNSLNNHNNHYMHNTPLTDRDQRERKWA